MSRRGGCAFIHGVSSTLSAFPPGSAACPEKLRILAARMVMTTRRSPRLSANRSNSTAARRLSGRRSHSGKGGGLKALNRAMAACKVEFC